MKDYEQPAIEMIATAVGEPVRINILWSLMDGRAKTATELAIITDLSLQSLSAHLRRLVDADLLSVKKQGRHRYFQLARVEVGEMLEKMAFLAPTPPINAVPVLRPVTFCRTCYDHLAGYIGVAITEKMLALGILIHEGGNYECTDQGRSFFSELGISIESLQQRRRSFARPCLDWSERKDHMAGSLAAEFLTKTIEMDWFRKKQGTRAITVTTKGRTELHARLGIDSF